MQHFDYLSLTSFDFCKKNQLKICFLIKFEFSSTGELSFLFL